MQEVRDEVRCLEMLTLRNLKFIARSIDANVIFSPSEIHNDLLHFLGVEFLVLVLMIRF